MASEDDSQDVLEDLDQDTSAEISDRSEVKDVAESDDTVAIKSYDISSFGADYDVEGLVKRLRRGDILIPGFQRDYVWTMNEASRFIESLLLGLPVPGVFLSKELGSNRLLTIDGQQRLKTLQFFYDGYFNPKKDDKSKKVFRLQKVQPQFEGRSFEMLEESDRIKLNDSIVHATVVKQESPSGDDTSIYYIFQRLNDGGRRLAPQEIRVAIFHGKLVEKIKSLNNFNLWRECYGRQSPRLKDQELILRFLALFENSDGYKRPMAEFFNEFASKNREADDDRLDYWQTTFEGSISLLYKVVGKKIFRPEKTINAAVFDSVMVGMARRLSSGVITDESSIKNQYDTLLDKAEYMERVSRSTADERYVKERIELATEAFAKVS